LALDQPLEQVAGAALSLATVLFVLDESVLDCREEIFTDDRRHGNAFLLLFSASRPPSRRRMLGTTC
jgi:hypothetical protein